MSKFSFLFGLLLISCFAFTGCGDKPEVIDVEPQTQEELDDYEAEMDASDPIER